MNNPYLSSGKRDSDVMPSEWPVVTRSELANLAKVEAMDQSTVNQAILALIRARKALNDARISCLTAARHHQGKKELTDRLTSIAAQLRIEHDRFPVTLVK